MLVSPEGLVLGNVPPWLVAMSAFLPWVFRGVCWVGRGAPASVVGGARVHSATQAGRGGSPLTAVSRGRG